jgi:5'-3' exonuclease
VIASLCRSILSDSKIDEAIIVSSDQDLYQLLHDRVRIWNPTKAKMITVGSFMKEWTIMPHEWVRVKACAGCRSVNIEGIVGVGEKTAVKWILDDLKPTTKAAKKIRDNIPMYNRNLQLVTLPYPGTRRFILQDDGFVTIENWQALCDRLGMRTLRNRPPIPVRNRGRRKQNSEEV